MNFYLKNLIIFISIAILFFGKTSFADIREVVLKDGQSFGDISFKKESPGKVFYKNQLLFQGVEGYDESSPRGAIEEVSIIDLGIKYFVTAFSGVTSTSEGYFVDRANGELNKIGIPTYVNYHFLSESKDNKYAVLYYPPEDPQTGEEFYLELVDVQKAEWLGFKYTENGIPKNFTIDDKYQFSFEDKSGIVKGDLLSFFKKDNIQIDITPKNLTTNNQEVDYSFKYKNIPMIVLWATALIVLVFVIKRKK